MVRWIKEMAYCDCDFCCKLQGVKRIIKELNRCCTGYNIAQKAIKEFEKHIEKDFADCPEHVKELRKKYGGKNRPEETQEQSRRWMRDLESETEEEDDEDEEDEDEEDDDEEE